MQIIHSVPMMVFPTHIFLYYFFSIEQIIACLELDSSLPPSVLLVPVPTPALPPLSRHLPHSSAKVSLTLTHPIDGKLPILFWPNSEFSF